MPFLSHISRWIPKISCPDPQILIRTSFSWKYPRLSQSGKSGRQWRSDGRSASGHTLSSSFWGLLRTGRLVTETSVRTFASGYISPDQSPFLDRIIVETWHRKSPQKILIRELILSSLTDAERRLLEILLGAHDDLRSSPKTIANQKTSIFHKLGLKNLRELRHIFENY